jgi:hypothetical protein
LTVIIDHIQQPGLISGLSVCPAFFDFKFGTTVTMEIVSKIILSIALLWQTSCAFISMEDYYRPGYTGEFGHLAHIDCCGGSGPEAVLVIDAPKGVQLSVIMWNGEAGNRQRMILGKKGRGTIGVLGIYAPEGVTVNFESDVVIFEDLQNEKKYKHKIEKVSIEHQKRWGNLCPNWVTYEHTEWREYMKSLNQNYEVVEDTQFLWAFRGKEKHGSFMWVHLESGEHFGNPNVFRVLLPSISVDGTKFEPDPAEFTWSQGGRYLYPLNC